MGTSGVRYERDAVKSDEVLIKVAESMIPEVNSGEFFAAMEMHSSHRADTTLRNIANPPSVTVGIRYGSEVTLCAMVYVAGTQTRTTTLLMPYKPEALPNFTVMAVRYSHFHPELLEVAPYVAGIEGVYSSDPADWLYGAALYAISTARNVRLNRSMLAEVW